MWLHQVLAQGHFYPCCSGAFVDCVLLLHDHDTKPNLLLAEVIYSLLRL